MDIAEVARISGLPASTLRYYEEKGLIRSSGRIGLRRQFDTATLQRLGLIAMGRRAGLTLDQIATMFSAEGTNIDRDLLREKALELDRTIRELAAMRDGLLHAADCNAASHFECPKFLRLLKVAARKPAAGRSGKNVKNGG
ncbi:helix-turn-helix domain-containing protein [Methylomonas koyamae]|uniref:MerR family transcriptional regulator n=1 Tax=Methylomonas koyamae TaxID=702114 RepID=A0A291IDW1_9GAMM|nr:helix-turn-helix domain-containing protein [Methylomonas koyamae]ATG88366.1 MerR family transcriptional regulator [Methylomonas koyamae]OAI21946.1 MerR family transcriptional regulator [Methylomonas koyamae]